MNKNINLEDKYNLINRIGSGTFGEVYIAEDMQNNIFAIKVEDNNSKSRIKEEYKIYKKLIKNGVKSGIPKIFEYIETPNYNIIVMELLGQSLDVLFDDFNKQFNLATVLKLSIEIINLLELIHKAGFLHRDIKPNNFLIGHKEKNKLYIMDFGLSKQYRLTNGKHIDITMDKSLVGTARYASTNIHMGIEPSRRDDLESVGYMLIYFIISNLPWQGLKAKKRDGKKICQIELIGEIKMCTDIDKLCKDIPLCFNKYIKYCKSLNFEEEPDYIYIKKLFTTATDELKLELKYCWE